MNNNNNTIVTFTSNSMGSIIHKGYDGAWRINASNANEMKYLICCHSKGTSKGNSFLLGKISKIVPDHEHEGRYNICIEEFAPFTSVVWDGSRNPIKYTYVDPMFIHALNFIKLVTPYN